MLTSAELITTIALGVVDSYADVIYISHVLRMFQINMLTSVKIIALDFSKTRIFKITHDLDFQKLAL